jgi:hypothetical protein
MRSRLRCSSRAQSGTRRCHRSGRQNRCRPKAGAWYETDAVSAARPPVGRSKSDRSQESGEAISLPHVCHFPATARVVRPGARVRDYPDAGINARLESSPLVPPAGPATRHDGGGYRRSCPQTRSLNCSSLIVYSRWTTSSKSSESPYACWRSLSSSSVTMKRFVLRSK